MQNLKFAFLFALQTWIYFLLAGCGMAFSEDIELEGKAFTEDAISFVQSEAGITFPDHTKGLNYAYIGRNVDPTFLAKFELADAGVDIVVTQLKQKNLSKAVILSSITEDCPWWNPMNGTVVAEFTYYSRGGCTHVYVCRFDDRNYLYIHCFKL